MKPVIMGEFQTEFFRSYFASPEIFPSTQGGTAVTNLVSCRLSRGLSTDVITLDSNVEEAIQCFRSDLINLWVIKRRRRKCIRDGYRQERGLILKALAESDADICHAHWTYEYGLSAVTQGLKPYVVTVHDHSWNILRWVGAPYLGQYLITQHVLRKARGSLTAVSPYVGDYVAHVTKSGTSVIPNVLADSVWDTPFVSKSYREPSDSTQIRILTIADSGRLKNVKRAIRAFQLLRGNRVDIQYKLIGVGLDSGGEIEQWAKSRGLAQYVEFAGWMPYDRVLEQMRSASVIFHPSLEESFGNPVAEAMAMGIPVIGTIKAGGVSWLLSEECGWLVNGRSVIALASALSQVLGKDHLLVNEKCTNARGRIRALCNSETILGQYEDMYRSVI